MAEAFGPQYAAQDYIMKLVKNGERCEQYWKTALAHLKEIGDSFVRGVQKKAAFRASGSIAPQGLPWDP